MHQTTLFQSRDERKAWALWGILFAVIVAGILTDHSTSVTWQYAAASEHWLQGTDLYRSDGRGFLYLPQAAILFVPFAALPHTLSEIAWRGLMVGVFAAGVLRLCRMVETSADVRLFPLVTCVTIPIACSAARNGQATLIIGGLMMLAVEEHSLRHWWRATILLCVGLSFKPLILVLILLVAGIDRRMLARLPVGLGVAMALPYFCQDGRYVSSQYVAFAEMLRPAVDEGTQRPWAHLFGLLQTAGVEVAAPAQTACRVAAAAATLLAGWCAYRRLPANRCGLYLFGLAGCYLMLFNPRTENNTYALIAPAVGLFGAEAYRVEQRRAWGALTVLFAVGIAGSYEIGRRLVPTADPVWLAPLMCLGFTFFVSGRLVHELWGAERGSACTPRADVRGRASREEPCGERLAA